VLSNEYGRPLPFSYMQRQVPHRDEESTYVVLEHFGISVHLAKVSLFDDDELLVLC